MFSTSREASPPARIETIKKIVHHVSVLLLIAASCASIAYGFANARICLPETNIPIWMIVTGSIVFLERAAFLHRKLEKKQGKEVGQLGGHVENKVGYRKKRTIGFFQVIFIFSLFVAPILLAAPASLEACDSRLPFFAIGYSSLCVLSIIVAYASHVFLKCKNTKWDII